MVNSPKCAVRLQSLLRLAVVSCEQGKQKVPAFFLEVLRERFFELMEFPWRVIYREFFVATFLRLVRRMRYFLRLKFCFERFGESVVVFEFYLI